MEYFHAPKKVVRLEMTVRKGNGEKETLSCALNNRSRPCFFEVCYQKDMLVCSECGKEFTD